MLAGDGEWLPPTCDCALAGISSGGGTHAVGGGGDLVSTVLDDYGVAAHLIGHVRHFVGAVMVILDVHLLGFAVRILEQITGIQRHSFPISIQNTDIESEGQTRRVLSLGVCLAIMLFNM